MTNEMFLSLNRYDWGFEYNDPNCFVNLQWKMTRESLSRHILLEILCCIYFAGWLAATAVMEQWKFFIYFSNWVYCLLIISMGIRSVLMLMAHSRLQDEPSPGIKKLNCSNGVMNWECRPGMSTLHKISWIVDNLSHPTAILTSILFWTLSTETLLHPITGLAVPLKIMQSIHVNALNTIYVILHVFITTFPVRWQHFYLPLAFTVVYLIFDMVYYFCGGTNLFGDPFIYPFLNWENPKVATVVTFTMCLAIILSHLMFYGLFALRLFLYKSRWRTMCRH